MYVTQKAYTLFALISIMLLRGSKTQQLDKTTKVTVLIFLDKI